MSNGCELASGAVAAVSSSGALAEGGAMNQLAPLPLAGPILPALIAAADERAQRRFLEFFAAAIRNPHTRRAYARAASDFLAWIAARGVASLGNVQPSTSQPGSRRWPASWPRPASNSSSPACATCSIGW